MHTQRKSSPTVHLKLVGILSVGILSAGILSVGILSVGILSAGILSAGILSVGILSVGILSCTLLTSGNHVKTQPMLGIPMLPRIAGISLHILGNPNASGDTPTYLGESNPKLHT